MGNKRHGKVAFFTSNIFAVQLLRNKLKTRFIEYQRHIVKILLISIGEKSLKVMVVFTKFANG